MKTPTTRVACVTHPHRYADRYASVTDQDGVTTVPASFCDECLWHLQESARASDMTLNESEALLVGQH